MISGCASARRWWLTKAMQRHCGKANVEEKRRSLTFVRDDTEVLPALQENCPSPVISTNGRDLLG